MLVQVSRPGGRTVCCPKCKNQVNAGTLLGVFGGLTMVCIMGRLLMQPLSEGSGDHTGRFALFAIIGIAALALVPICKHLFVERDDRN
ncbi:MAG: hypothetical protein R3C18_17755 [Planctomycetaceae bacterium]